MEGGAIGQLDHENRVKEGAEGVKRGLRFKSLRSGEICEKREMHGMILVQDLA